MLHDIINGGEQAVKVEGGEGSNVCDYRGGSSQSARGVWGHASPETFGILDSLRALLIYMYLLLRSFFLADLLYTHSAII